MTPEAVVAYLSSLTPYDRVNVEAMSSFDAKKLKELRAAGKGNRFALRAVDAAMALKELKNNPVLEKLSGAMEKAREAIQTVKEIGDKASTVIATAEQVAEVIETSAATPAAEAVQVGHTVKVAKPPPRDKALERWKKRVSSERRRKR